MFKIQLENPFIFQPYHEKIRTPFDYYKFGIDFLRPLVNIKESTLTGKNNISTIKNVLKRGNNVILFSNHQIEADPQAISILLEDDYGSLAENIIFVAGTRVTSDPLAIPFSMGRNLLCIHSKKYINTPIEEKHAKQIHNKRTMQKMADLLAEGGKIIFVAPSGGRDRLNENNFIEVSPFDYRSIEMFYLMSKKSQKKTHFYPLSLSTHHLLPPPETIEVELGEQRLTRGGAIHMHFGDEIDMELTTYQNIIPCSKNKRQARSEYIWDLVNKEYQKFPK